MGWTWQYEKADGAVIDATELGEAATTTDFPSQSDAESWLGESWRELLAAGAHQVTLFEDDRKVYGPMGLSTD